MAFGPIAGKGSSPLARGTQQRSCLKKTPFGLIPARAGNTRFVVTLSTCWWAHPRSRGEHLNTGTTTQSQLGSSPLARGTLTYRYVLTPQVGLIPARAGNTAQAGRHVRCLWAHPRSRGEHTSTQHHLDHLVGSSPLARGTPGDRVITGITAGLIPARAGNTSYPSLPYPLPGAHPRSRGEHMVSVTEGLPSAGSSPLARGTPLREGNLNRMSGLIPARAGNTNDRPRAVRDRRAHPRSRGEHQQARKMVFTSAGSSPLARGTPGQPARPPPGWGLIPARAGNTYSSRESPLRYGAHPRSRGEHTEVEDARKRKPGSSPLARGTLGDASWLKSLHGLIPARAGNT